MILQANPDLPVDDLLIDAALHCYEYDSQCNGTHAEQLTELLQLRPNYRELVLQIAERFAVEFEFPTWEKTDLHFQDIAQVYRLLACNRVSYRVTEVIHTRFARRYAVETGLGYSEILATEGADGLLFVAETVGGVLRADPEFRTGGDFHCCLGKLSETGCDWRDILTRAAGDSTNVGTFLAAVEADEEEWVTPRSPWQPPGMASIMALLQHRKHCAYFKVRLADSEQRTLRRMFMRETGPANLGTICHVLSRSGGVTRTMIPRLWELSHYPDAYLAEKAIMALATLQSSTIRRIAIREMRDHPEGWCFAGLLKKNWRPGDERLFLRVFNRLRNPFARHSMILTARCVEAAPVSLLKYLLLRTACGGCRAKMAVRLEASGALDDTLAREFLHDAMADVREIGQRHFASRP